MAELCEVFGSDKGGYKVNKLVSLETKHSYTDYYETIFVNKEEVRWVFECGIGTNNLDVDSNMGLGGKPGASLRVWKKYFKNANIVGVDIDKRILFEEDRIETYFLDQLDVNSILQFWKSRGNECYDLMIDDGLHQLGASMNLLKYSIDRLSPTGVYVIEDVDLRKNDHYKKEIEEMKLNIFVEYIILHRKRTFVGDNCLVVIRKTLEI